MATYRIKRFSSEKTDSKKAKDFIIGAIEAQAAIEAAKKLMKGKTGSRTAAALGIGTGLVATDSLRRAHRLTRKEKSKDF